MFDDRSLWRFVAANYFCNEVAENPMGFFGFLGSSDVPDVKTLRSTFDRATALADGFMAELRNVEEARGWKRPEPG